MTVVEDLTPANALHRIRVVLVEPLGPLNVGAIARVMKNMGLHHLVLVNPQCDPLGPEARQMAVHAADVLEAARIVPTLAAALIDCRRAIATTGRPRTLAQTLEAPRAALPWLLETTEVNSAALIFGPEDRGLNNAELNQAQRFIYIPTSPVYPSLNLAQAVGICCYELFQFIQSQAAPSPVGAAQQATGWGSPSQTPDPSVSPSLPTANPPESGQVTELAPLQDLEGFLQHLESVLLKIGYLYPHTAKSRMQKFRRLFSRSFPSTTEVALLRGILSQVEWATQQNAARKNDDP